MATSGADRDDAAGALVAALGQALAPHADPARANGMAAYMHHRFPFLGVPTPVRRRATAALIKGWCGNPLPAAQALWHCPEREFQYLACDLLERHGHDLVAADLDGLLALVVDKSWWDTVDTLAKRVGTLVRGDPSLVSRLDCLIADDNLWLRRVALLHQLGWKAATDRDRLFAYCRQRAGDRDFFIRKAIGWALRDYAWQAPEAVRAFLAETGQELSPLSRREAAKNL